MECLCGFASSISTDLVRGAINQLRYPCCFNNFVEELAREEGNFIATRVSVQDRVAHAKKQTRKTAEVVEKWLEEATIEEANVNHLLEVARTNKSCCFGHCPNWIWRYHLGKKLAKTKKDLERCIQQGRQYIQVERTATLPSGTLDILSEKYLNFESRQSSHKQVMEALNDDEIAMIGLYGMGGCGKTTLAMQVKKIAEEEHLFDKVLFVPVSSTVEVRRIQEKIASSIQYTFPENEKEERERAQRLYQRLTQENKILVILDDVWQMLDFDAIGIPSTEHHKGCKVLITTRLEAVCTLMDCQKKIQLQILTDEETWALFQKQAHISEGTSDTLKHLAREISDECKGLPVAIAAVASSLKGKDEVIWRVTLNKLRSSKPINIEKGLQDPYKCLQLSYDNLETEEAKSLFLLCSVFPEDYEIPIEILTRCAIGLGVVGEVRSYEEARSEVIAAKIKLVSSCLLLDADDESVKMHDLVRDVAHLIAKNENKVIKCELENDATLGKNSIRYLWCRKIPNDLDCSNLEFLCMDTKLEVSDEIFKRMEKLKVLILVDGGGLPLSTISFKTLTDLRCLILNEWELSDISFVTDMKKLHSLTLDDCSLPLSLELQTNVIVTQLTNLKLLSLHECEMERNIFKVIKIPQLEELCIVNRSKKWDDYSEFFKTFSIPQTLQFYVIKLGDYDDDDDDDDDRLSCFSHKRTLLLSHFHISNEAIKDLAKKAKVLLMANIQGGAKNIVPHIFELKEGGMNELNKLQICNSEEIEYLVDTSNHLSEVGTLFSKLLKLRIKTMNHLRALWHGCLPSCGTFEKLEKLYLSDCPRLTFLFTNAIARCLVQLKELEIFRCDGLKHILADDDTTEINLDEFKVELPVQSIIFQNLQKLVVHKCGELKHVFSASTIGGLPQLKMLQIEQCNQLDQIIEDIVPSSPIMNYPFALQDQKQEQDEIIEDEQHRHILNPHFEANQLENFPESTSIPSTSLVNHSSGSFTLSSLTSLILKSCPKLSSLFTASTAKTLTSLEELTIEDCTGLKHILTRERAHKSQKENIVEDDHDLQSVISIFGSLKVLHINRFDLLQYIFPVSFVGGPVKLKDIRNEETSYLKYLFAQNNFEDNSCHLQPKTIQIGQQVSLGLEELQLEHLPQMTYIWVASENSFTLQYLKILEVVGCAKLEVIFPPSVSRCLPELERLEIRECKELKQIIEEDVEDKKSSSVLSTQPCFPKLVKLVVEQCHKLRWFFSVSASNDLPNLEVLIINGATELEEHIGCEQGASKKFFTFGNLKRLEIVGFKKLEVIFPSSVSRCLPELERLEIRECKELKQIIEEDVEDKKLSNLLSTQPCFPKLAELVVQQCHKLKRLFSVSASNDLPNLEVLIINGATALEELIGCDQGASKNSFTFQNLKKLEIVGCAKLEVIFPPSVSRCLPELKWLEIRECKELKQIIEEDVEDKKLSNLLSTQPCFPKLAKLIVEQCHEMKRLFSVSASNDLPNLEVLIINGAVELEELIGCEQRKGDEKGRTKVELPKLKLLIFMDLSTLRLGTELLTVKHRVVHNCPELSLTSTTSPQELSENFPYTDFENTGLSRWDFVKLINQMTALKEVSTSSGTNKLPSSSWIKELESGKEFIEDVPCSEVLATATSTNSEQNGRSSPSPLDMCQRETHSQDLVDGQSTSGSHLTDQQKPLGETESTIGIPQLVDEESSNEAGFPDQHAVGQTMNIEEIGKESIQEWPPSEETTVKTLSAGVESIDLGGGVATHTDSSGRDILARDSQVVEQDDKLNEGKTGITPCKKIQIQQGSNLMDKKEGTGIVSNDSIEVPPDIHTRLGACKHFVDLDDAQIALLGEAIAAYPHLWNAYEKFSERFHAWMLKTMADMLLFLRNDSTVGVTPQREKEFHELSNEAVQLEFERSWVDKMRQLVVARDPELEGDHARERIHELLKRSTGEDVVPDSQVVEQNDRQIEHWRGTSLCEKIQNVDNSIQEESNMINKEGEIGVVSNDPILAPRNEEPEKGFVAKVSTSETPEITTPLTNTELVERPSPSYLDIPLHKTLSNELVDRQSMSEPCLMNQQKPLGEISIKTVAKEGTTSKNTNVAAQSMHSESASSQSGQLVTSQSKSYSHSENRSSSQTETYTAKEREGHPKNIQDFGFNDITSVFQPVAVEEDGEGQVTTSSVVAGTAEHHSTKDNRVVKALADLETCLQMPLKDIASSETNSLRLLTALNFLSNLPLKDVTLSDGLKDIIDSMHKEFPGILSSFKQAFAANDKLEVLEAHWNEVSITLVSKISKAKNFTDEAQQKEAVLKEQIIRLKKEMKDCETVLSSLQEEKKKCIAETTGYKKELENVKKNKSQMVEDQRKVQQELFEVAYKWSALCSQFEYNRIAARNPP